MSQSSVAIVQQPSQLAFDHLAGALDVLLGEARLLVGLDSPYLTHASLSLSNVSADIWHAFPQPAVVGGDSTWKVIATSGRADIAAFCEHGKRCPDRPIEGVQP